MMTWMQTRFGRKWELAGPEGPVRWDEIAHALSHICRFTGHTTKFYSVAEHSCRVHDLMPAKREYQLAGLLHDAHEAFIGDIATPIVGALAQIVPDAKVAITQLKDWHDELIFTAAGQSWPLRSGVHDAVKAADMTMLMTERRDLMGPSPEPWGHYEDYPALPGRIKPMSPKVARKAFLYRLRMLGVV